MSWPPHSSRRPRPESLREILDRLEAPLYRELLAADARGLVIRLAILRRQDERVELLGTLTEPQRLALAELDYDDRTALADALRDLAHEIAPT